MKYLVLGARGQVGQEFTKLLPSKQMHGINREELDVRDAGRVVEVLQGIDFDVVVNLAAFHNVNECEERPDEAFAVNAQGALHVAAAASKLDKKVVFVSSDYVFGGEPGRDRPYHEFDAPAPLNVYGVTKLAGEQLVSLACEDHLIVRTASLYGSTTSKKGWTFPELMLKKARAGERLEVVDDQVMTPTYTLDLVRSIIGLVESDARGVFHVSNLGACSWFEFARETLTTAGVEALMNPVNSDQFPAKAKRPSYSALATRRLASVGVEPPQRWEASLSHYLAEIGELSAIAR